MVSAGELPEQRGKADLDRRVRQLQNESFLAYAVLPSGPVAWLFDDRGVKGKRPSTVRAERTGSGRIALSSRMLRSAIGSARTPTGCETPL